MNILRPLLAVLVIAAACWTNVTFSEHHTPEGDFEVVHMFGHLMPATLVVHGEEGAHVGDDEGAADDAFVGVDEVTDDEFVGTIGGESHADGHGATKPLMPPVKLPAFLGFLDMDGDATNGAQLLLTNFQIFMILSVLLVFILLGGVADYVRTGKGDIISRTFAGFCMYVRDEMVYPVMGAKTGRAFLPFFMALFFFLVFMNVGGLIPFTATPTAAIAVTFALAAIILFVMVIGGMIAQGPIAYFKHLVPEVPLWLWPLMFVVEIIGVLAKPFALMVRLFANLSGGHMVVLSFIGLIFLANSMAGTTTGWAVSPFAVGFGVFIMIIEAFVALLQAYVFTYLAILFVGGSLHPDH